MGFSITSPAFQNGSSIPPLYSRKEGKDISPALQWSGVPSATKSLTLMVLDPDAPDPAKPKVTWCHWIVYNLPSDSSGLAEDVQSFPGNTMQGLNDWKETRYGGPAPPKGRHRYYFKLFALDNVLDLEPTAANKDTVQSALKGHIIDETEVMGTFEKSS